MTLKKEEEILKRNSQISAKAFDNLSRNVMDIRRHLKQRHKTAPSKRDDIK